MNFRTTLAALLAFACFLAPPAPAQEQDVEAGGPTLDSLVQWQRGPSVGDLGGIASINVPKGYFFADGKDTRTLMELMQNPTSGKEMGFIAPTSLEWFIVFEFDDIGYVKDDEKDKLDANAMLESIREGNENGNKVRRKNGWPTLEITGWELPPRYNPETHNLEWAIRGTSEGQPVLNYNTRLLGRGGVMGVTLVAGPEIINDVLPHSKQLINDFAFSTGHKYAEYRQGDKIAKYGLTALVVGGATAVAMKSGFFKYLWKAIVIGALAVGAFFKKLFGRKTDDAGPSTPPPTT